MLLRHRTPSLKQARGLLQAFSAALFRRFGVRATAHAAAIVDGHQDLPSDGHEVGSTAIAESNRIRWSLRREICSLPIICISPRVAVVAYQAPISLLGAASALSATGGVVRHRRGFSRGAHGTRRSRYGIQARDVWFVMAGPGGCHRDW